MWRVSCLLPALLGILAVIDTRRFSRPGSRVCSAGVQSRTVSYLKSQVQPVYQPYLTLCEGRKICSTYRTTYRISQHQGYQKVSQPVYVCCPGWRRTGSPSKIGCNTAVCRPPCRNGGKCSLPNKCSCPAGWKGRCCQTDVDECAEKTHGCSQVCLNVPGSYRCDCWQGYSLHADGKTCQALDPPTECPVTSSPGSNLMVQDEVKELSSRLAALEEKFQLVLAPFLKLEPPGMEAGLTDPISLLLHSVQQLDRIESLSEQISFLEEQLESCSCKN